MKSPNVTISSSFIKEINSLHDPKEKSTTPRHKHKHSIVKTPNSASIGSGVALSTNNTYNSAINATQSTFTSTNASNMFNKPVKNSLFNNKDHVNDSRTSLIDKYKEKSNVSAVSSANNSDKNNKSSNSGHSARNDKLKTNNNLQTLTNISKTPRNKDLVSNLIDADIQKFKSTYNKKDKEKDIINQSSEYVNEYSTPKNNIVKTLKQNLNSKGFIGFPLKSEKNKINTFITKSTSKDSELTLRDNLKQDDKISKSNKDSVILINKFDS